MEDINTTVAELLRQGRAAVLATIIKQAGPAPRGVGAKCLILDDGSLAGTIGGGLLEGRTLEEARQVFETGLPLRLLFNLKGTDVAGTDMLCGGDVEVFLEPVSPTNESLLPVYEKSAEVNRRGGEAILATVIHQREWRPGQVPKMFMAREGESSGSLSGAQRIKDLLAQEMDRIIRAGRPLTLSAVNEAGEPVELYVEPITSEPALYVFGGGHVAKQIVHLGSLVGFKVIVIDDRPEFADPSIFPDAKEVCQLPFEGVLDRLPVDGSSYLVIVTRGHIHDKTVLSQALSTPARYLGMIGSRRKRDAIYDALKGEGFTEDDLSRVHSPIGLAIGAETPEEIAVSIVAELIKVRAGRA
jgi:xanthine dehydrogenase accessory factor